MQNKLLPADLLLPGSNADHKSGWAAKLALSYRKQGKRSFIQKIAHEGPLLVQRSFHPNGPEMAYNYVLHPPGGMVGGDTLNISVHMEADAAAFLTTPSAGKIYRCLDQASQIHTDIVLEQHSRLFFLPLETIVFDQSSHQAGMRLSLVSTSQCVFWEITCLGRTGCGELFTSGSLKSVCEIVLDGSLFYKERSVYTGGDAMLDASWGLNGYPAYGTLYFYRQKIKDQLNGLADLDAGADIEWALTTLGDLTIIRARARSTEFIRKLFTLLIEKITFRMDGVGIVLPRIWNY